MEIKLQKQSDCWRTNAAHFGKGRSWALPERNVLSSLFLLSGCRSVSYICLSLPNYNFLKICLGRWTPADLLSILKEKSTSSLDALLMAHSSICHDLYTARASNSDECVCVRVCLIEHVWKWAYVPALKICLHRPSSFFPNLTSFPNHGRSSHIRLRVYTLISSKNPKTPMWPVCFPTLPLSPS